MRRLGATRAVRQRSRAAGAAARAAVDRFGQRDGGDGLGALGPGPAAERADGVSIDKDFRTLTWGIPVAFAPAGPKPAGVIG